MRPSKLTCALALAALCAASACAVRGGPGAGPEEADASGPSPSLDETSASADGGSSSSGGGPGATGDVYKAIYDAVDAARLEKLLGDMTGSNPVMVNGASVSITERYSPAGKARYRAYWKQYYEALGMKTSDITLPISNLVGETTGTSLEAVLPGKSADSVVVSVHYDSTGVQGHETENPAVDDQMTGMAIQMELARILSTYPNRDKTIRFAAPDYEEISDNLDGDAAYLKYLQALAKSQAFQIVAAVDNDQSGWSCWNENNCGSSAGVKPLPAPNSTLTISSCGGLTATLGPYDYADIRNQFMAVAAKYSPLQVHTECDYDYDSDMSPFAVAGIPSLYVEEFDQDDNPHYDDTGDDTMQHIDKAYFESIARVTVTFEATLVGVAGAAAPQ
jgi:Peptidase family M28